MDDIENGLGLVVHKLSDQNYEQSLALCRLWHEIGRTYSLTSLDLIFNAIWNNRTNMNWKNSLIHPAAHLIIRFASDAESDHTQALAPHASGLQSRLCAKSLRKFFNDNMVLVCYNESRCTTWPLIDFVADANLIACWANRGYVEEAAIRNHILQSLISHEVLYGHQAYALIVLFKLAGATFAAYADPSVVDRCFDLLERYSKGDSTRWKPVQEVIELRERGWEGLPPPPVFSTGKPRPTDANQNDSAATPVATSLGLPNEDLGPQVPRPHPLEFITTSETDTIPRSPITQSPSTSISVLSDLTIEDTSDEEPLVDPTVVTHHGTFYLQDGNVEVLCGNTLFRVHTSIMSFHSPTLNQMFAQTGLATAESPNGCPRILSSDTAVDFTILLKMIYLPSFPERNKVPGFATFSSLLRITTRYKMPAVRTQMLEVIRDAYPETFEGLDPSKPLGETVFSGPTPHPNAVLNLFVQEKLTSALPVAYYMAVRRGLDSLMDGCLPASARLPPETLKVAMRGLIALREMELKETHRLILGPEAAHQCSSTACPSRGAVGPTRWKAYQSFVDRLTDSCGTGTKILQVISPDDVRGDDCYGFCEDYVRGWRHGHVGVRGKAWAALPDVFGFKL